MDKLGLLLHGQCLDGEEEGLLRHMSLGAGLVLSCSTASPSSSSRQLNSHMDVPVVMFIVDLKISHLAVNWSQACTSDPAWSLGGSILALTDGPAEFCAGVIGLPCMVLA